MSNLPRRIEVEEALSQVSEAAREFYRRLYPFVKSDIFHHGRVEKFDDFVPTAARELAKAGLIMIEVKLKPVDYDDQYRSWKEQWERIKDLPSRQ